MDKVIAVLKNKVIVVRKTQMPGQSIFTDVILNSHDESNCIVLGHTNDCRTTCRMHG